MELERLEQELRPMADTVRQTLVKVNEEIEHDKQTLRALYAMRSRLTALLKQLDPDAVPTQKKQKGYDVGGATYQAFSDWLVLHREEINQGPGIYASGLYDDPGFGIISNKSQISKALARAHSDGLIRIDSMGQGGRKYFKVVA